MKTIPLTQGYVALVDDEDYERAMAFKWYAQVARRKDGVVRNVYAVRGIRRMGTYTIVLLHRFILGTTDKSLDVDHKNHNGLDCQRDNLRTCTHTQNKQNSLAYLTSKSGFKGVTRIERLGKWQANIRVNGKLVCLGCFSTVEAAASAYNTAAIKEFGEFAHLNTIHSGASSHDQQSN